MRILLTGGAGYIGSHALRKLLKAGHDVTVLDDLSHGHELALQTASQGLARKPHWVRMSTADRAKVAEVLFERQIDAVMHFAAFIEVGESVSDPAKYYRNNFSSTLALMEAMRETDIKKLVFSSTAAVYGSPVSTPILEDQPCAPINPYGRSKLMVEHAIEDFASAYGLGYAILRYFNVAGASPECEIGEAHDPESHLIPRVLDAACGKSEAIEIFGTDYDTRDGTCIRDYVHVDDLVDAHLLALESIRPGSGDVFNLGSESGFSVREVIAACELATGKRIFAVERQRRSGDPAVLVASSAKIRKKLGWRRRYPDLQTIVAHAWSWHQKKDRAFSMPLSGHFGRKLHDTSCDDMASFPAEARLMGNREISSDGIHDSYSHAQKTPSARTQQMIRERDHSGRS
jgi:UDP-glucose 4-epimerase